MSVKYLRFQPEAEIFDESYAFLISLANRCNDLAYPGDYEWIMTDRPQVVRRKAPFDRCMHHHRDAVPALVDHPCLDAVPTD